MRSSSRSPGRPRDPSSGLEDLLLDLLLQADEALLEREPAVVVVLALRALDVLEGRVGVVVEPAIRQQADLVVLRLPPVARAVGGVLEQLLVDVARPVEAVLLVRGQAG